MKTPEDSSLHEAGDEHPEPTPPDREAPASTGWLFAHDSREHPGQNYNIVAQSAEDVQNIQNSPSISMGPYLTQSGQETLLRTISIYTLRGVSRDEVRLLYMNEVALNVWRAMGKNPRILGTMHRPPRSSLLAFGMPFSE